jgi:hypothetical protein
VVEVLDETNIYVPQQATVAHEALQWGACYIRHTIPLQAQITVDFAIYKAVYCSV